MMGIAVVVDTPAKYDNAPANKGTINFVLMADILSGYVFPQFMNFSKPGFRKILVIIIPALILFFLAVLSLIIKVPENN